LTHGKKDVKEMIFFIDPILAWIKEQLADPEIAVIVFEARAQVRVKTRCELADGEPGNYLCMALNPKGVFESAQNLAGNNLEGRYERRFGNTIVRINTTVTYQENPDAPVIQIIKPVGSALDDFRAPIKTKLPQSIPTDSPETRKHPLLRLFRRR